MKKIDSFKVDHRFLEPGIYVSTRASLDGVYVTTFDIRITRPYKEPVLSTGIIHTIEHIGATYLRIESSISDKIIYFGPMGCRTGFYLVLFGSYSSKDILPTIVDLFNHIHNYKGKIPGATIMECGNYKDMDLEGAKQVSNHFLSNTLNIIDDNHLSYQFMLD